MKMIILVLIGAAVLLVTAGCEEEGHEHHNYGGAYDGGYRGYGHDQWQPYPADNGNWNQRDDWRSH